MNSLTKNYWDRKRRVHSKTGKQTLLEAVLPAKSVCFSPSYFCPLCITGGKPGPRPHSDVASTWIHTTLPRFFTADSSKVQTARI